MNVSTGIIGVAAAVWAAATVFSAAASEPKVPVCAAPPSLTFLDAALDRTATLVDQGKPITIVAIGSSSTLGIGATAPELSYPSRLEAELKARYPQDAIRVINRGIGGEDAPEEFARLTHDVIDDHPDLVIWQVGTNAVLRRDDIAADDALIRRGVAKMREAGIDLVLMDLQYAPRILERPAYMDMERLLADVARREHIGLFRRFDIMKHWARTGQLDPSAMVGADGVHMTDIGYHCLAARLAEGLSWSWWENRPSAARPLASAVARLDHSGPSVTIDHRISGPPKN